MLPAYLLSSHFNHILLKLISELLMIWLSMGHKSLDHNLLLTHSIFSTECGYIYEGFNKYLEFA